MISDLGRVIEQVSRDKGIDRQILIDTLVEAIKSAIKKRYGFADNFEVTYNEELGEVEVFQFKEAVEKVTDDKVQISLKDARSLDPESQVGDELGVKMDTADFGRIAAQSAKQVIIQRMKDAERDIVFEDFKEREGEIINGIVQRFDKGNIIVNLGRTDAILPVSEQVPKETYHQGDRVRGLVLEVKHISRGPQIVLSRTHPGFLRALFEMEVPEIAEDIVHIKAIAREPGSRSKIAVLSEDKDIDPVGACVGMRGSRVQSVVQELRGEKIDIIPYADDPARFIVNALAPAVVSRVIMDEVNKTMEVVVPDEQLSLAIGKKGQNVRLASKLSGWRIDVKNETKYERTLKDGYQSLVALPGVTEDIADKLYDGGYTSVFEILSASAEEISQAAALSEARAAEIMEAARISVDHLDAAEIAAKQGKQPKRGDNPDSAGNREPGLAAVSSPAEEENENHEGQPSTEPDKDSPQA